MFYYLNGALTLLTASAAVVECGGVGYYLSISGSTYDALVRKGAFDASGNTTGVKVKVYTYLSVTQDGVSLYGFAAESECSVFKLLITVSGVGPKAALAILTAHSCESLAAAIAANDAKAISRAQGVGLKTAQKVILELKDKLAKGFDLAGGDAAGSGSTAGYTPSSAAEEAIEALTVLGYSSGEATKAVRAAGGKTVEDIIRNALALLIK